MELGLNGIQYIKDYSLGVLLISFANQRPNYHQNCYFLTLRDSVETSTRVKEIVRPLMPMNGAFSWDVSLKIREFILS